MNGTEKGRRKKAYIQRRETHNIKKWHTENHTSQKHHAYVCTLAVCTCCIDDGPIYMNLLIQMTVTAVKPIEQMKIWFRVDGVDGTDDCKTMITWNGCAFLCIAIVINETLLNKQPNNRFSTNQMINICKCILIGTIATFYRRNVVRLPWHGF